MNGLIVGELFHQLEVSLHLNEISSKIDNHPILSRRFYEGPCHRKLVEITLLEIERNSSDIWKGWCVCMTSKLDILKKLSTTVANCILSKKVKKFNNTVIGRDNTKLQKFAS